MGLFPPQFNTPLSVTQIDPQLSIFPIYGVTPDHKYIPVSVNEMGELVVEATFSGSITIGEIGVSDESSFTYGTSLEQPIGGVYQDTAPMLFPGETGAVRLTQYRAFHTNLRDSSGNEIFPSTESTSLLILSDLNQFTFSSNGLKIDGSGVTQPISATVLPLPTNASQETGGNLDSINVGIETLNSLVPSVYDYIALSYTGDNLTTAVYKFGGSNGTIISTLTIAYDVDNNILSVTRT